MIFSWTTCLTLLISWSFILVPALAQENKPADRTEVIVAFPREFPPHCFLDEQGKPVGFAIDVMNEVARLAKLKVVYRPKETFVDATNALLNGSADIIPNSGITAERLIDSDYTTPIETFEVVIFVRETTHDIHSLADLMGRRVAVLPTNVGEKIVNEQKKITGVLYQDISTALFDLLAGKVDAFIYPKPAALMLAREAGIDELIKIVSPPLVEIKRGIRVRKGDKLLNRLNPAVEQFLRSAEYKKIYSKWYGKPRPFWTPARVMITFGSTLTILFALMFIWRYKSLTRINTELQQTIDERKQIQDNLVQANIKLNELDNLKSMFIATMSHELRTPLNSVIGFTGMTLDGQSGEINEEQKDNLTRVFKLGHHLLELVNDVIDISKIEAGKADVSPELFYIKKIIDEVADSMQEKFNKKGLSLETDVDANLQILTDRKKFQQCVTNLISNAVKFTEKGAISISAREKDIDIEISVADTGIGIPVEEFVRIFQPFERLESRLKVKAGGTGLGLYLTKKIVNEVLKGDISVESEEGKGCIFKLRIPKDIKQSKEPGITANIEDLTHGYSQH